MTYEEFLFPMKNRLEITEFQKWADLGCGEGVFTKALAEILPSQSEIFAIDRTFQRLDKIMSDDVSVNFQQANFEKDQLNLNDLNGILMANSFHFIQDKIKLISNLETYFSHKKQFLIVEYETDISNQWVPFPINFIKLKALFHELNYQKIEKINERKSAFGGSMYVTWVTKN